MKKLSFVIFLVLSVVFENAQVQASQNPQDSLIREALDQAKTQVFAQQIDQTYWNMPLYLGSIYVSQYFLIRNWLEISIKNSKLKLNPLSSTRLNEERLKSLLIQTQLADGSWELVRDQNRIQGDLNATIWNYAALKVLGEASSSSVMTRARKFILSQGGLVRSSVFSKILLSLFGNYSWNEIPAIPYLIFDENLPMNHKSFGQWVSPHLYPISYLRRLQVTKYLGFRFDWSELLGEAMQRQSDEISVKSIPPRHEDRELIIKMLESQKPYGSWGAYTLSTLLTLMALDHYQNFYSDLDLTIQRARERGVSYLEEMYLNSKESAYLGTACDGRYWDTMLIGQGLVEAGADARELVPVLHYLLGIQNSAGGFGFGLDFERDYPDTDDTAEVLLYVFKQTQGRWGEDEAVAAQVRRAVLWLFSMQNADGGWGAFDKNNTGNFFLSFMTRKLTDSADLFDESSTDVTGHILEALGTFGYTLDHSSQIKKAVQYLKDNQSPSGAWEARWGVNYLYGTGAVLVGLAQVGVPLSEPWVRKASSWLLTCQNADGGYGESFYSYTDLKHSCHGMSTPSQTSWALMGLIAAGEGKTQVAHRAALYLAKTYFKEGGWKDHSVVGTGHPRIVPMQYPSYAWAFPLMALSRYLRSFKLDPKPALP